MRIIAIRHGQTSYNQSHLINGRFDEPLSDAGRKQNKELVRELAPYTVSVVYSSTLKRSVETAKPIALEHKVRLLLDERLTEVDMGSFTGKPWGSTVAKLGLDSSGVLSTCAYDLTPYGGESAAQVIERVQQFLADLQKDPSQSPLLVTHGGILRILYYLCDHKKVEHIPNSTIHTFEI